MAVNRGLFVRATGTAPTKVGTTPIESRLAMAGLVAENAPGVPRSGVLAQALNPQNIVAASASSMVYPVAPFEAVISRSAAEGVYILSVSGTTNVATDPAPGTGSRWDIVYIKQNDTDKGDPNNNGVLDVVKGTPGTSPTKPTVPTGALALAEARIFAGTTAASGGANTITQLHTWTASRGAPVIVRDLADRNTITAPAQGQQVVRLDRGSELQTYTGAGPVSGWEYLGRPRRYYADSLTFDGTSNQQSKLIGSCTAQGVQTYPTKMRANGRLAVSCGAIASGLLSISINVSVGQSQANLAQQKSRLTFVPPGGYWATASAETDWVNQGAGTDGLIRIWIEHLSGTVNHASTSTGVYSHLWVEILPQDD